ncbi:lipase 1-like [Maniola hyperantus]|uniref:lipase 1-like n=1 Tax=Aphantopus hyperantus TaxID=2795564 RepID=UPI001567E2EC|nr:lipase 1-like [Maniola hyperantus]
MWTSLSLWLTVTVICTTQQIGYISAEEFPEDAALDSIGLATKYGHPPIQYNVATEDGYILAVYRLPGKGKRPPILCTHGLMDSTDTFLIRGYTSLPITLADRGYDVWLANTRGNRYTRRHQHLDPDTDPAFWNFTFHEMGVYDLPAIIDLVLNETGANNLTAIGHSQGNTIYYVLGSEKPEYNSKINVLISLAPMAYVHNTPLPVATIIKLTPIITTLVKDLGLHELLGDTTALGRIAHTLCSVPVIGYTICAYGLLYPLVGSDPTELEPEFFQNLAPHYPGGSSIVSLLHYLQVGYRKTFAQYDHGSEINQKMYNSSEPPVYQLARVTMPIALYTAANDGFSSLADVQLLRGQLPNVVYYLLSPRLICNHVDYVWGQTVSYYLYPFIDIMLDRYNPL